jgi:predicted metal-binding membrane protein
MTAQTLDVVLRRDRTTVLAALVALTALAWIYVLWLAARVDMAGAPGGSMPSMTTPEASMPGMLAPALRPWGAAEFTFMFIMWAVMMVGMMLPSAAPMMLIYARVGREAARQNAPFASTGWFAGGYLAAWTGFSLIATVAQWALERAALLTPMMASASGAFGGLLLIAAGVYQWTPLKDACLAQCPAPLVFIQRYGMRADALGSMQLGLRHGLYCVGCCWILMALLFVGGVMNILWIAGLAIFVLLEKIVPAGRLVARTAGVSLIVSGAALLSAALAFF